MSLAVTARLILFVRVTPVLGSFSLLVLSGVLGLLLLAGCSVKEPSLFDPVPNPAWYERKDKELPKAKTSSPLPSSFLTAASGSGAAMVWAQRSQDSSDLWFSATEKPHSKQLLVRRSPSESYLNLSLSPDGTRCLALRRGFSQQSGELQVILELWTLPKSEPEILSIKAVPEFDPTWIESSRFLFAESDSGSAQVVEVEIGGQRRKGPTLNAPYPHLLISGLDSQGWVIYDRTRPHDAHFWVRTATEPGGPWFELLVPGADLRWLGWWEGAPIVVTREGLGRSRFLHLAKGSFDLTEGVLKLDGAEEIATVGSVASVLMKNGRIVFFEKDDWGHLLFSLDVKTKAVTEVLLPCSPVEGRRLYEMGESRVSTILEGPLQPPSLGVIDLDLLKFSWLKEYRLQGLEASSIRIERKPDSLHLLPLSSSRETPVLMEAYGGFRMPLVMAFDWVWAEWLRRGGSVRLEHIQGQPKAQEASRDELLDRLAAIDSDRIVLRGRSMGGTLALMAALKSPQKVLAVWADSAVTDLLHYFLVAPGELWIPEFGDPREAHQQKRLRALSPLLNIKSQNLPKVLMSASPRDTIVDPRHTTRFVQRWEEIHPGREIALLGSKEGGHARAEVHEQQRAVDYLWAVVSKAQAR